jgi:enoyl-[acyl-carrier protein] reductase II
MSEAKMVDEISATRAATDRPFGVDLLTAMPGDLVHSVELVIEGGASAFVAGLGVPSKVVELCHEHGLLVVSMCGKVDHARRAVDAGCDLVVAQGTEAGGHTGTVATMPLVPMIVDAVGHDVPVVAAGGIFDGRGLAASLALGADGIWVGTRFIATPEARGIPGFKDSILAAKEDGTTVSRAYSGKTMRVIKNDTTAYYEQNPGALKPFPDQLGVSFREGTFHLGGDETTPGIERERAIQRVRRSGRSTSSCQPASCWPRSCKRRRPCWPRSAHSPDGERAGAAAGPTWILEVRCLHRHPACAARDGHQGPLDRATRWLARTPRRVVGARDGLTGLLITTLDRKRCRRKN